MGSLGVDSELEREGEGHGMVRRWKGRVKQEGMCLASIGLGVGRTDSSCCMGGKQQELS